MPFENALVIARLGAPIATYDWTLPLDGILLYQAMRRRLGVLDVVAAGEVAIEQYDADVVPLACIENGSEWFYAASFALWPPPIAEGNVAWTKYFDTQHDFMLDEKVRSIDQSRGRFKAYHQHIFYRHALAVVWAVRGDLIAIERLLADVFAIGKKTAQGWGRVIEWRVIPIAQDFSVWGPDGHLMRAVPLSWCTRQGYTPSLLSIRGYRPPYYAPNNIAEVAMPEEDHESHALLASLTT